MSSMRMLGARYPIAQRLRSQNAERRSRALRARLRGRAEAAIVDVPLPIRCGNCSDVDGKVAGGPPQIVTLHPTVRGRRGGPSGAVLLESGWLAARLRSSRERLVPPN